jgi:hypothetical protein
MIQHLKMMKETRRHILHIYQLLDALYMGIHDPVVRTYYDLLKKEGPYSKISGERIIDETMAKEQNKVKEEVTKQIKDSNDPAEIIRMERALTEVDNIFTLLRTLGPDSSKEYREQVEKEIEGSKKKIFGLD